MPGLFVEPKLGMKEEAALNFGPRTPQERGLCHVLQRS